MKKKFDCIVESRKWKAATGRRLMKMTPEEQTAYLNDNLEEKLKALAVAKPKMRKRVRKSRKVIA